MARRSKEAKFLHMMRIEAQNILGVVSNDSKKWQTKLQGTVALFNYLLAVYTAKHLKISIKKHPAWQDPSHELRKRNPEANSITRNIFGTAGTTAVIGTSLGGDGKVK